MSLLYFSSLISQFPTTHSELTLRERANGFYLQMVHSLVIMCLTYTELPDIIERHVVTSFFSCFYIKLLYRPLFYRSL